MSKIRRLTFVSIVVVILLVAVQPIYASAVTEGDVTGSIEQTPDDGEQPAPTPIPNFPDELPATGSDPASNMLLWLVVGVAIGIVGGGLVWKFGTPEPMESENHSQLEG